MSLFELLRAAIGYRLMLLGLAILPADLRQIERAAQRVGMDELNARLDHLTATKNGRQRHETGE